MADILPSVLFPNMTADVTGITIPYTDIPALSQAEADPATGDGREVARGLIEAIATSVLALDTANAPTQFLVTKANPVGQGINTIRQSYTMSFDQVIDPTNASMDSEA